MFTEVLDGDAGRWFEERVQSCVSNLGNGNRALGLPSTPASGNHCDSGSYTEYEVYSSRYSFVSSPGDDEIRESDTTLHPNVEKTAKQKILSCDNIPSAPPLVGSGPQGNQILNNEEHGASFFIMRESRSTISRRISSQSASHRRTASVPQVDVSPIPMPASLPTFDASGQAIWRAIYTFEACCRLCSHSWEQEQCMEAPYFLNNDYAVLQEAFGLRQVLLQSDKELLARQSPALVNDGAALESRKTLGKMKMQLEVRKLKMGLGPPTCSRFSSLKPQMPKLETFHSHLSKFKFKLSSEMKAIRKVCVASHTPAQGLSSQLLKQVSGLLGLKKSSSHDMMQVKYSCLLRLKSSFEENVVRMQPGSGATHVFFPGSLCDDLIIEVQDSKGQNKGRVVAPVASIFYDPGNKLRWWPIYHQSEHEVIGRVQLSVSFSNTPVENDNLQFTSSADTMAYDSLLAVVMKVQPIKQRNFLLHGPWEWLVSKFASSYRVSDAYTKLRYLSYVMDVATPTNDCLVLVTDLLLPVITKCKGKNDLSYQEKRYLAEIEDKVQQILRLVFENYKSLDESSPSGMMDVFKPATGTVAPALVSALNLYTLLHDILSPQAQLKLCRYFQAAAKKRSKEHLALTNELILSSDRATLMDPVTLSTSYRKMKSFILTIRNEISTDIEINNQNVLPSSIDLPNISSAIYCVDLCNRLRDFLVACPPPSLSPPVAELVIATADFQRDLVRLNINPVRGGVDAKELFQEYIKLWIQETRHTLLGLCKVKWSDVRNQRSRVPLVEDMYVRLKKMMDDYEVIVFLWPEYKKKLEKVIADIEKAIIEALDRQYADVLRPLKDNLSSKIYGLKYVQKKISKRSDTYVVSNELGNILNSMRRMLDISRPEIEAKLNSWTSCIPPDNRDNMGEDCSGGVTVTLRAKFRSYIHAVVKKLADNTRLQRKTRLKNIIQDLRDTTVESDVQGKMQPLRDMLMRTMDHLHTIVDSHVLKAACRGLWDQMGKEVLCFLENTKKKKSYKGLRFAVSILDDIFALEMQKLLGNALQEKDLKPPPNIREVHSLLSKDAVVMDCYC